MAFHCILGTPLQQSGSFPCTLPAVMLLSRSSPGYQQPVL